MGMSLHVILFFVIASYQLNKDIQMIAVIGPYCPVVALAIAAQSPIFTTTSQDILMVEPFRNTYVSNNGASVPIVGNVLVGVEQPLPRKFKWQAAASYYRDASYVIQGTVLQFANPAYDNLNYNYRIAADRVLFETKLLGTYNTILHPYVTGGLGVIYNRAYGYHEERVVSTAAPMQVKFLDKTAVGFTYMGGAGADLDIVSYLRLGLRFQYSGLGNASLGPIPNQAVAKGLEAPRLRAAEYILQATYLF